MVQSNDIAKQTDPGHRPPDTGRPDGASGNRSLAGTASPMMRQYLDIKEAHPDTLLFYRMGDFYEMFFEDAEKAAPVLDIALTRRGKHKDMDIPMCGVPVHSADTYLARLIRKGFRVAVCEQTEDPAEARRRGSKSVVKREVRRVITPGTVIEETLLDQRRHNYLAALASAEGKFGLAWLDISTGEFFCHPRSEKELSSALARIEPGELLVPERLVSRPELDAALVDHGEAVRTLPDSAFDSEAARRQLEGILEVRSLDAFGDFSRAELSASGAVLQYVAETQKGRMPRLQPLRRLAQGSVMEIDAATRRNLELVRTLGGDRAGSLLSVIDRTVSGAGSRLLAARLAAPLTNVEEITARLDSVSWLVARRPQCEEIRTRMAAIPDISRSLSRLALGRGGPRDLAAIRDGLAAAAEIREILAATDTLPREINEAVAALNGHDQVRDRLCAALDDDLPIAVRDGDFIRALWSGELDELRSLRDASRRHIAELQARYVGETGITSLKIRHNNVLGYFIEVTAVQVENMPKAVDSPFIHRQTLANSVRYTTTELADLEGRLAQAGERALSLELSLFEALATEVAENAEAISATAAALCVLDVSAGLAVLSMERRYVRPMIEDSTGFQVKGGRHPVVEAANLAEAADAFVANDCDLAEDRRLWLVTGPNMAGKSTFLRQNALISILAQMGSFVPADEARLGIVDRLFSRVGAADDLARGRSTFMVEMVETAAILNQATSRSLVILDEIGRGTATFDGLSIAWAALEHLHDINRCRALFATHFHELTSLTSRLDSLSCQTMRVKEWRNEVVFLHEVISGTANQSYGIHVAKLAGLPSVVIARAKEVLEVLEQEERSGKLADLAADLPLFSTTRAAPRESKPSAVEHELSEINPDELSPRDALDLLYRLKRLMQDAQEDPMTSITDRDPASLGSERP